MQTLSPFCAYFGLNVDALHLLSLLRPFLSIHTHLPCVLLNPKLGAFLPSFALIEIILLSSSTRRCLLPLWL